MAKKGVSNKKEQKPKPPSMMTMEEFRVAFKREEIKVNPNSGVGTLGGTVSKGGH